jgi:hypothetical protein
MSVLFCACDVMNVLSVKKMKIYKTKRKKRLQTAVIQQREMINTDC